MDLIFLRETVLLSIKTGLLAVLINLPMALTGAYLLDRVIIRNKSLIEGFINLPLVMPPVTTGYVLLLLLGKRGVLGSMIYSLTGRSLAFTQGAAVLASMIVSYPLIIRSIRTSMNMVDSRLEKAAMTLGAGKISVFRRITLPLIIPGVLSGMVLGFARSLGEFGATITFAGNIEGVTRTIPLSVYTCLQIPGREQEAAILVALSVGISFLSMFVTSRIGRRVSHES